jgi:outer membrane protein OmpA-like peptidoglycan-associated protein
MMMKKREVSFCVMAGLLTATMLSGNDAMARRLLPSSPSVEIRLQALRILEDTVAAERAGGTGFASGEAIPFKPASNYTPPAPPAPKATPPVIKEVVAAPPPPPPPAPVVKEIATPPVPVPAPVPAPKKEPEKVTPPKEEIAAPVVTPTVPEPIPEAVIETTPKEKELVEPVINAPELKEEPTPQPPLKVLEEKSEQSAEEVASEVDLESLLKEEDGLVPSPLIKEKNEAEKDAPKESPPITQEKNEDQQKPLTLEELPEPELPVEDPDLKALETPPAEEVPPLAEIPTEQPVTETPEDISELKKEETPPAPPPASDSLDTVNDAPSPDIKEETTEDMQEAVQEDAELDKALEALEKEPPAEEAALIPEEEIALPPDMLKEEPAPDAVPDNEQIQEFLASEETPIVPQEEEKTEPKPDDLSKTEDAPIIEKEEKSSGWLPNLGRGFTAFLGGKKQPEPAPSAPVEATEKESLNEKESSKENVDLSPPQDSALPSLPTFAEKQSAVAPDETLPELPEFDNSSAATQPQDDAPLPDLPFGEDAAKTEQKERSAPADADIDIASLPKEDAQPLNAAPVAALRKGKALSVQFSEAETEVPLSAQEPLVALSKQITANESAQVKIVAYASGSKDQASIARRISLARALSVRAFLIDLGVDNVRISVQAMGNDIPEGESERADIIISD